MHPQSTVGSVPESVIPRVEQLGRSIGGCTRDSTTSAEADSGRTVERERTRARNDDLPEGPGEEQAVKGYCYNVENEENEHRGRE